MFKRNAFTITFALGSTFCLFSQGATAQTPPAAPANYLIDPTGGSKLVYTDPDNGTRPTARALGFSFPFFAETLTGVFPAVNGCIAWNASNAAVGTFDTGVFPVGSVRRIAPLWDDLALVGTTDSITEKKSAGIYSLTYLLHKKGQTGSLPPGMDFQVNLFGAETTIGTFKFLSGDIAFCYQAVAPPLGGTCIIGLNAGDGAKFAVPIATLGGQPTGVFSNLSKLPLYTTTKQFILFRRSATGTYTATVESVTAPPP